MTQHPDLFAALAAPFEPQEVKLRQAAGGRQLHYITARTAMNRLDAVVGPENWKPEFFETKDGLRCRISLRLPDGEWVPKEDGGGFAGMAAEDDNEKSGFSDSFKRAAVMWGIARYLYRDGVPAFVTEREPGVAKLPPEPPQVQTPAPSPPRQPSAPAPAPSPPPRQQPARSQGNGQSVPRTGKALFAWTKDMEAQHDTALLKYLNGWSKLQEFPSRMIDWDEEQVSTAYAEACRKLKSITSQETSEADEAVNGYQAPSETAAGGAAQTMNTAVIRSAEEFTVRAQRARLLNLIWDIARRTKGSDDVTDADFVRAGVGLDAVQPEGRTIPIAITECTDSELLAAYIHSAMEQLDLLASERPVDA